jgi:hypothetical protein
VADRTLKRVDLIDPLYECGPPGVFRTDATEVRVSSFGYCPAKRRSNCEESGKSRKLKVSGSTRSKTVTGILPKAEEIELGGKLGVISIAVTDSWGHLLEFTAPKKQAYSCITGKAR